MIRFSPRTAIYAPTGLHATRNHSPRTVRHPPAGGKSAPGTFIHSATRHEAIGGDPRDVERAKQQTMAAIHAINVRLTANAIHTLHHDLPPLSSPAGAAQQDQDTAPPTPLTPASGSRGEAGPSGTRSGDFHTPDGAR